MNTAPDGTHETCEGDPWDPCQCWWCVNDRNAARKVPRREPQAPLRLHDEHTAAPGTVWDLVVRDMHSRDALGMRKYGRPLLPHDGRDSLQDAYEEALDLAVYLRKSMLERDGK